MDRRVQRTRRALRESLQALVVERGWERVTVRDVCRRADVGRSTFYAHFADREELLLSGFDDLKQELRTLDPRPFGFVPGLVAHVDQHRELGRRVMARRHGPPVRSRITRLVVDLVEEDLAKSAPASPLREPAARFLGGALVELLLWRLDERRDLPAPELERLFHQLSAPVLAELAG